MNDAFKSQHVWFLLGNWQKSSSLVTRLTTFFPVQSDDGGLLVGYLTRHQTHLRKYQYTSYVGHFMLCFRTSVYFCKMSIIPTLEDANGVHCWPLKVWTLRHTYVSQWVHALAKTHTSSLSNTVSILFFTWDAMNRAINGAPIICISPQWSALYRYHQVDKMSRTLPWFSLSESKSTKQHASVGVTRKTQYLVRIQRKYCHFTSTIQVYLLLINIF